VRLRWYEDDAGRALGDEAFLEIKRKIGGLRRKHREPAPIGAALASGLRLSDARLAALPEHLRRRGHDLPALLRPAFVVRYRRRRFVEPGGTRVALDDRIHVPAVHAPQLPSGRRPRLDVAVVESKGPGVEPPASLRRLVDLRCRRGAFSKYEECFVRLIDRLP